MLVGPKKCWLFRGNIILLRSLFQEEISIEIQATTSLLLISVELFLKVLWIQIILVMENSGQEMVSGAQLFIKIIVEIKHTI